MDNTMLAGLTALEARPGGPSDQPPVLFIHGMWEGAWLWEEWLDLFAGRGFPAHALNLRGHDGSRPVNDLGKVRFTEYLEDARAAYEALGEPLLVGHSMGGLVVQKLAEELDPPAAVAITPAAPRGILAVSTLTTLKAALRHLPEILFGRQLVPTFEEMVELELNRLPPDEQRRVFSRQQPESGRQLFDIAVMGVAVDPARVTCPLLVVGAADDRITPAAMVARVAARYGAEHREYPGHAHMILVEPGWERVAGEVADWLAAHAPGG